MPMQVQWPLENVPSGVEDSFLRLDGGASRLRALGWCSGDRTMADMAICCLAVAGVDGCGWSAAFRWAAGERPVQRLRLVGSPRGPNQVDCPGAGSLRPETTRTAGVPYGPRRGCRRRQAELLCARLLETRLGLAHRPHRPERPYLPPGRSGARCASSAGLPRAPRSEPSPSPEPPSAHCTAEEPVWAKQGPLSVG